MPRIVLIALVCATAVIAPAAASAAGHAPARSRAHPRHLSARAHPRHGAAVRAPVGSRDPVSAAATIALRFWHATPCGGHVVVRAAQPLAAGLGPGTDGWASFDSSLGPDDLAAPASSYTNCTITLARWQWATPTVMEGDWGMFCLTVVHEMGHLLGHAHTDRRGSVMNPVFSSDADVPAACNAAWLPGWRDAGVA